MLVTGRGWVVATVAALLGGIGAFCGAIGNVLGGVNFAAAATAHVSPDAAARFVSEYAAPVVMGFALWRNRRLSRWMAVLFTVGIDVAEAQRSTGAVVILLMLAWAVAVLLGARIWEPTARPAARNLGPVPGPVGSI